MQIELDKIFFGFQLKFESIPTWTTKVATIYSFQIAKFTITTSWSRNQK